MNSEFKYLFFGFGSEYVLNPLYNYMINKGYKCVEIDLLYETKTIEKIKQLKGERIVFITSSHLFFDQKNFKNIYDITGDIISPLELIYYLNPVMKIYYPHDLTMPLQEYDMKLISQFDVLLSPLRYLSKFNRYLKVIHVGWIKKENSFQQSIASNKNINIVHAFCEFAEYFNRGFNSTFDYWKPIWSANVKVKFPDWPGSIQFEEKLKEKGIEVYPSKSNMIKVISENDIVITNSTTSVTIESALAGRLTLNVLDGFFSKDTLLKKYAGFENIKILSKEECDSYIEQVKGDFNTGKLYEDKLAPFDFSKAEMVLTSYVEARTMRGI